MDIQSIRNSIPAAFYEILVNEKIAELRPAQEKSIKKGLLEGKNLLVCTPTASGKTLIAELACFKTIFEEKGKAVYIVPLKALASEKYNDFRRKYGGKAKIGLSIGDSDASDSYLSDYDMIITTSEKLDSLLRHRVPWLMNVKVIVVDEIHLLNDADRGPTLEIIITILKKLLKNVQLIGLSATIGNPKELAEWLTAELVEDTWRPVKLQKGIYFGGELEIHKTS
ncbi:DEAD/DEAH box helicase [Candidatus Woesearchaeota archaeon]|nr:DEAD/DEAH box helicase [Candidatus Woesearchaeota archaeon]